MPDEKIVPHKLENVESRAKDYPGSFHIPSRMEREDLWPGDLVKLIFASISERLWIQVASQEKDDSFVGIVISMPANPSVKRGDRIPFRPEHVADIEYGDMRRLRSKKKTSLIQ